METITKPANEVRVGDVVETEDGFTLFYMRVTQPIAMDHRVTTSGTDSWFVVVGEMVGGEEDGEAGELYIDPTDMVEVAVAEPDADAAVAAEDERIARLDHDGDSFEPLQEA